MSPAAHHAGAPSRARRARAARPITRALRAPIVPPATQVVDSGLSEEELTKMVYATINAELPEYQQAAAGQAVISS